MFGPANGTLAKGSFPDKGTRHTSIFTANDGRHIYNVTCTFLSSIRPPVLRSEVVAFSVDSSPPVILSINASQLFSPAGKTIYTDRLSAAWVGIDFESGIDVYKYAVFNESDMLIYPYTETKEPKARLTGLSLKANSTYKFKVFAVNNAGLSSPISVSEGIFVDPTAPSGSCANGIRDGTESAVDCGGSCSLKCSNGNTCFDDVDCQSLFCSQNNECTASSCTDNDKNGEETDVDCGSSCSKKCELGKECNNDNDCKSDICNNVGRCIDDEDRGNPSPSPNPSSSTSNSTDRDRDTVDNNEDNCPDAMNPDQEDLDNDLLGDACDDDADGDKMPDNWERDNSLNPAKPDAQDDPDSDGVSNYNEYVAGTNPTSADQSQVAKESTGINFLQILMWGIILVIVLTIVALAAILVKQKQKKPAQEPFKPISFGPLPNEPSRPMPPMQNSPTKGELAVMKLRRMKKADERKDTFVPFDAYAPKPQVPPLPPPTEQKKTQDKMDDPFKALSEMASRTPPKVTILTPKIEVKVEPEPKKIEAKKPEPKKQRPGKTLPMSEMNKSQVLTSVRDFAHDKRSTKELSRKVLESLLRSKKLPKADMRQIVDTLVDEKILSKKDQPGLYSEFKLSKKKSS